MRDHRPLGRARRAARVNENRRVVGCYFGHARRDERLVPGRRHHVFPSDEPFVRPSRLVEPARIPHDDELELGEVALHLEELLDLVAPFDERDTHVRVIQEIRELPGRERRIRADRDERRELPAHVADAPLGARAADDADLVAGREASLREERGERDRALAKLLPRGGKPHAVFLGLPRHLARRRAGAAQEEVWERLRLLGERDGRIGRRNDAIEHDDEPPGERAHARMKRDQVSRSLLRARRRGRNEKVEF